MPYAQLHLDGSVSREIDDGLVIAWDADHFCTPGALTAEEAALFRVVPLLPADPPAYNPATETVSRDGTEWRDEDLVYRWAIRALTPDEIEAAYNETRRIIIAKITLASQSRINAFAATRGYDSVDSMSKYKDISDAEIAILPAAEQPLVERFRAECRYLALATASTWARLCLVLAEVEAGIRPAPASFDDVESELPPLAWPV